MTDEAKRKKKEIIEICLQEFLVKGLEKTSVRDLCKVIVINGSTLYYYFDSKDNVIIECIKHEIEVIDTIIQSAVKSKLPTVTDFLKRIFEEFTKIGGGIRFIAQVFASPNHFKSCRSEVAALHKRYDNYAKQICDYYNISFEMFRPMFYIYLTIIYDYLIKGDEEYFKMQTDAVFEGVEKMF